jgi:hypothetical protein
VSGTTTLRLRLGRNIPLHSACMACMGNNTLTVIISFGKLMPIKSELTYPKYISMSDNVPLCYMWKRAAVYSSKLHHLFVTFL